MVIQMRDIQQDNIQQLKTQIQTYLKIIDTKHYELRKTDSKYNLDCFDFRCNGQFTNERSEYDFIAVSCTNRLDHQPMFYCKRQNDDWFSFRNGWNLEENIAVCLLTKRGTKEDQLHRLNQWLKQQYHQTQHYEQQFESWKKELS